MKSLICPQCGGQITSYAPGQLFTTCQYCSTKFLIEPNKQPGPEIAEPKYTPILQGGPKPQMIIGVFTGVFVVFGLVFFIAIASSSKRSTPTRPTLFASSPTAKPTASATATPDLNLLEFGGTGTGNGLIQDGNSIAVDQRGRIYVADETLRVQQFDENGAFLRLWQVPSRTEYYSRARQINKIDVAGDGTVYVAVGGVIHLYSEQSAEPLRTLHVAPDYIQDFALRSDGGVLMISNNEQIETLNIANKAGKITRRVRGFHTDTADAALSPPVTGVLAIRMAVDGAGNIFSIYAFGDIGSYELSYNDDELLIFRFTSDVKYVNKFVETLDSCGIEVDNQSRIYISRGNSIEAYSNKGDLVSAFPDIGSVNAFALDKDNNVYALADNTVIKRPAIQ